MASSRIISHSPPNLHRQSSPSDSIKPIPTVNLTLPLKRHRNLCIRASQNDTSHSVELQINPNDVVSKDPIALPRPLSSNQLNTAVSDGSRLRVAYQVFSFFLLALHAKHFQYYRS